MKTYTKKIGATRAIASIIAANTELFDLEVIKLEEIKGEDGSFHIRATVSDPNVIDLERLKAETRIGELIIEDAASTKCSECGREMMAEERGDVTGPELVCDACSGNIDPALAAGGTFKEIMKPADQAIPAQRRGAKVKVVAKAFDDNGQTMTFEGETAPAFLHKDGIIRDTAPSASEKAAAKRAAKAPAPKPQVEENADAPEAPAPKPSILEMAMTVEQARIASPKETPDEARAAALVMYGAEAKEGIDFEIVKGGRGLFSALPPALAATFKRTTHMVLTAEEASAAKNRKRIEQADRPKRTRGDGTKPVGMQAIVAELCLRKQGATPAELKAATNWQGTPWKWFLGNNPKKTGMADRFGYQFEARKGAGKEVTYFFRLPEAVDAQASTTDNDPQVAAA